MADPIRETTEAEILATAQALDEALDRAQQMTAPIGRLSGPPPYRAWELRADCKPGGPWGIQCAGGFNCYVGAGGNTFLMSREAAELVIRSHGHEPGEPVHG